MHLMILIILGIKVLALDVYPRITVVALNSSMIGSNWLGANSTWVLNISIIDWHRGKGEAVNRWGEMKQYLITRKVSRSKKLQYWSSTLIINK